MAEIFKQPRLRWTIGFLLLHLLVFFPYIEPPLSNEGTLWLMLQGPLGLIISVIVDDPRLGAILFIFAWYFCEVSSIFLWQAYYHKKVFSRVMLGIFIFSRSFWIFMITQAMRHYE